MGKEKASSSYYIITAFSKRKVGKMSAVQRNVWLAVNLCVYLCLGLLPHLHPQLFTENTYSNLKAHTCNHCQSVHHFYSWCYICMLCRKLSFVFFTDWVSYHHPLHTYFSLIFFFCSLKQLVFSKQFAFYIKYTYYRHTREEN